ncbi:hypothetical protein IFM89_026537 [Coptis chinensis]|uniref:Hydroxyproline O-arabinosyltransferase-like domain-containing protein n=1 Tax=Coptis chinensis TaxID=261450 RepID=A0A835H0P0_9MAGN|nr:hypothetical protein IFM89_026537 [Coptis chinensis]
MLKKNFPTWMNVSISMKNDPETDKTFGWVLEMYGYAVASALHGVQHILRKDFMIQGEANIWKNWGVALRQEIVSSWSSTKKLVLATTWSSGECGHVGDKGE